MKENIKILIIDDEPAILEMLKKTFVCEGFCVDTAEGGVSAFRMILKKTYHLVISDIRMPGINGIDLLQKIKTVKPDTDVLIITAYNTHDNIKRAFQFKASGLLFKPFSIEQIKTKVHRILEMRGLLGTNQCEGHLINSGTEKSCL